MRDLQSVLHKWRNDFETLLSPHSSPPAIVSDNAVGVDVADDLSIPENENLNSKLDRNEVDHAINMRLKLRKAPGLDKMYCGTVHEYSHIRHRNYPNI